MLLLASVNSVNNIIGTNYYFLLLLSLHRYNIVLTSNSVIKSYKVLIIKAWRDGYLTQLNSVTKLFCINSFSRLL